MGRRSKVVDRDEAIRMLRSGVTYAQMVRFYKGKYGVDTTEMMWSRFVHKELGERRVSKYHYDFIPWQATPRSRGMRLRHGLRAVGAIASGDEVSDSTRTLARQLKNRLAKNDTVVDYDPFNDVFLEVPRRKGIDQGWVRDPFISDRGAFVLPGGHVRKGAIEEYVRTGGMSLVDLEREIPSDEERRQPKMMEVAVVLAV